MAPFQGWSSPLSMDAEGFSLQKRKMQKLGVWANVGLICMWTATAQLPCAVEAGKSSWCLPSTLGCVLPGSWELNGFASAEENLFLSTCVTGLCRPRHSNRGLTVGRVQGPAALLLLLHLPISRETVKWGCTSSIY